MLRKVGRCHKRLTDPSHDMWKEYLHLANKECEFLRNVHFEFSYQPEYSFGKMFSPDIETFTFLYWAEWKRETNDLAKPRNRNWKSWGIVNYIKHDIWAKSTNIRSTKIQSFTSGNVVWFVAISVRYESRVICILHMHGSHTFSITVFKTSSYKYIFVSVIKSISIWESEVRLTTCFNIVV